MCVSAFYVLVVLVYQCGSFNESLINRFVIADNKTSLDFVVHIEIICLHYIHTGGATLHVAAADPVADTQLF